MKKTKGILLTLIGGIFWGLSGACGQFLFQYKEASANWLVPIRLTTAGFLLLLILFFQRGTRIFDVWKTRRTSAQILIYGIFGMMLCQYTYFVTIQHSNAGIATVLQYLSPVIILVVVCLGKRLLPSPVEVTALILAVSGTFFLSTHGDFHSFVISGTALRWGLLAACAYAFYTLYSSRLLKTFDSPLIIGWGMFLGGLALMPILKPWTMHPIIDGGTLLALFAIIVLGSIVSFTLYATGVQLIGPSMTSMIASIEPVAATILSVVWLGDPFTGMDILGFVCILSTIFLLAMPGTGCKR